MRAGEALAAMRALPARDFATAFGAAGIAVLAPHPDDESLGCGGLIAEACALGRPPLVVFLTDGSASHPNSAAYPRDRLRRVREAEAIAATAILGVPESHVAFMRLADTAAPSSGPEMDAAAARLGALAQAWRCEVMAVPWRHDPHCDHEAAAVIAAHACARAGIRLLSYPVWGLTLPEDRLIDAAPISGFRLDIATHLARKRRAILAHASQYAGLITDDPAGFQMSSDFISRFLGPTEIFMDHAPLAVAA
jgi:LmbE family N-acetylglucosaminyl deacetylase